MSTLAVVLVAWLGLDLLFVAAMWLARSSNEKRRRAVRAAGATTKRS